jgi:2-polyprenyl-3-methyl-5-hydroxy-6-metoxy-1,4-benzoquinol methylase
MSDLLPEYARLEQVADQYDSESDFDRNFSEFAAQLILEEFRGKSLLEIGCASGVMTRQFAGRVTDLHVVEGSEKYISAVRKALGDKVQCHRCLAHEFKPARLFDGIVMASLLEHVDAPVPLLQSAGSWLSPDGVLFVVVPNANSIHRQVGVAMGLLETTTAFTERDRLLGHRRVYTEDLLRQHLEEAGFSVCRRQGIMIKVVSNAQMAAWPDATVHALLEVGRGYTEIAAQIYMSCRLRS